MKNFLLSVLIFTSLAASSQTYNNEWINYSRTYYKFKIGVTGLCRINQPVLASLNIGSTPAEQFQLWRNGKQIPIYTTVQTGAMGSTDYIEFWGEINDGKPDNILYRDVDFQLNDKWSLQTDTAVFFLTINPVIAQNLRLAPASFTLPSALPVEPYFMSTAGKYFKERLNPGNAQLVGDYVYSSAYDQGEGWTSNDIANGTSLNITFPSLFPYTGAGAPAPQLKINAAGNAANQRDFTVRLNGTQLLNQTMDYFDYVKSVNAATVAQISSGTASIDVTNNSSTANDRMVIAQAELIYARQFNFGGAATDFSFDLPANNSGNYLEIAGFNTGSIPPVLYDLTNGKRYVGDISSPGLVRVVLQPSATARKLVLAVLVPGYAVAITSLQKRNFVNYSLAANQGNYLIITHPALLNGTGGTTPVEAYRAYRASAAGGSYNAKVYMIDDLVDQFAYGIKMHPLSVRNFIRWARSNFSTPLKDVLLIGKGLTYTNVRVFESYPDYDKLSFVPTFGQPASDNLLAADPGLDEIPKVPIGRISIINGDELAVYLAKMIQYEQAQGSSSPAISDKAWMKNVVHVEGSSEPTLQLILDNYMDKYSGIISDTLFGGLVYKFAKNTANPVEELSSDKLKDLFHEGLGLVTYFGHSSASTLEFNLDNPDQYDNAGKYPVMIVMGCNAGNFFNYNTLRLITKETLSEKFVLADQKGSIAFIASSHLGIVHYLDIFNTQTYTGAATTFYGKTLGETLINSIAQVYNITTQNDFYARFHCEQTILHGDPALKINSFSKPDYVIEDQLVKVSPSFISVAETSFRVDAKFQNLGRAVNKKIVVEVKRTYPDLTTQVIRRDTIPGIRFVDSLSYTIPIVGSRDKGLNKITITVDADNAVDEIYETNNSITKDVFIYENEARPVYPYTYAIVNKQNIKLIASTANPFVTLKQYTLELDTTESFNSSFKVTRTISTTGGVLEFTPGITFTDSTVYYWRVSPVSQGAPVWNSSSFVYLSNSDVGFNQSHFFQKTKSTYDRVILDSASRSLKFGSITNNLFIRQGTWITSGATQEAALSIAINGIASIRLCCWYSSLVINVFDPVSFQPWRNHTLVHDNYPADLGLGLYESSANQCRSDEERYFNFEYRYTDTAGRRKIMNFLKNVIPDGAYVAIRNFSLDPAFGFPEAFASVWQADTAYYGHGNSLYHIIKNAGLSSIDSFYRTRPFALVYKKNDATFTPKWLMGDGMFDNPTLSVDCSTVDTVGTVTSPAFGPAKAWKQLKWRGSSETTPGDVATVDVIGINNAGIETPLYTNITTAQQDFDVSSINASAYPFVKLRMRTQDSIHYTPYQLRYWRLTYDPSPEGAIAPNIYLKAKDTVEVGEPTEYKVAFKNISGVAFDSLKVKMVITDKNNVPHIVPIAKRRPLLTLAPNDTLYLGATINTANIPGLNVVYLEANPDNDQPEQYHFNNFAYRNLYVKPDSISPFLDVTFDGQHILNRDIVSPKPDIIVKLKDEAHWLSLDDTSLLTINVRYPDGSIRRFYFNNDTLRFNPAGQAPTTDNTATINFKPLFTKDGEYELIVTGKDKSNNSAGSIEYRVAFEVINKPMISNMLNYPNPFTTSTAFVFTITGTEVPQNIKIEIMTITGKIVREITKDELGSLHIGRNITDFKWNGTDQYGQKLANGIYLYRVVTNLNGKALDKYKAQDDNTDKYFNKGYGKMYLMR